MALTLYEASKLSRNPLASGIMEAIVTSDEALAVLPMVPKAGESFSYNREKALPTTEFVTPDHSSITESGATFDRVTVPMRLLVSDVDVYNFAEEQQSDTTMQRATQIEQKAKAAGRTIGNKLITGGYATSVTLQPSMAGVATPVAGPLQDTDRHGPGELFYDQGAGELFYRAPGDRTFGPGQSEVGDPTLTLVSDNPNKTLTITVTTLSLPGADQTSSVLVASTTNEPDGVQKLCPTSQIIASTGGNGDALTFEKMDQLIDMVKVRDNLAFMAPDAIIRKFKALARGLGGTTPDMVAVPGVTAPVPTYAGIPILRNDWIPKNESKGSGTTLSSLYLASMQAEQGLWAGVSSRGGAFDVNGDPRNVRVMGLRLRDIGELEGKEARRTRLSMYIAFALGSPLAIARASELVTA